MILHTALGHHPFEMKRRLYLLVQSGHIRLGGNKRLKIYGTLQCTSGKRLSINNRVFFATATEAQSAGYRPCGHCMRAAYMLWKDTMKKQ